MISRSLLIVGCVLVQTFWVFSAPLKTTISTASVASEDEVLSTTPSFKYSESTSTVSIPNSTSNNSSTTEITSTLDLTSTLSTTESAAPTSQFTASESTSTSESASTASDSTYTSESSTPYSTASESTSTSESASTASDSTYTSESSTPYSTASDSTYTSESSTPYSASESTVEFTTTFEPTTSTTLEPTTTTSTSTRTFTSTSTSTSTSTTTTTTTTTTPAPPKCSTIRDLIVISSSNTTIMTDSLNAYYNALNRTERGNFAGYNKRVQTIIWNPRNDPNYDSPAEKLKGIAQTLSGSTGNAARKKQLYSALISPWTEKVGYYVNCVNQIYGTNYQ
ncbi:hypothetical protein M3Y96_01062100 [Aphelenchoides besseyi]|nr:hypothetical protein M3Y96_01062100 [Aphelenchoides besseyi]